MSHFDQRRRRKPQQAAPARTRRRRRVKARRFGCSVSMLLVRRCMHARCYTWVVPIAVLRRLYHACRYPSARTGAPDTIDTAGFMGTGK
ncbi:hypothetical protein LX36DRAFT_654321 [Colletotrichum falcatum]|nr:hypothetical protein LX36DRAFT_654321 [Colletotrichum falcatum]